MRFDSKVQFPEDCLALASKQNIYAPQLKELGVIDEVIWEKEGEDCKWAGCSLLSQFFFQ